MSKTSNTILSFLSGAIVGAVAGILYAPDTGKNTREKLSYKLTHYREKLEEFIDELINAKEHPTSEAKSLGQKVIDEAKEKAESLLEDVDQLIEQIKSEK